MTTHTAYDRKTEYDLVTSQVMKALEEGTVPWHKPWNSHGFAPRNFLSGKTYRGVNLFILAMSHFDSPFWGTYKQWSEKGCQVRRGEKGTRIVFWKVGDRPVETEAGNVESKRSFILKGYTVFNADQVDGTEGKLPSVETTSAHSPIDAAERVWMTWTERPNVRPSDLAAYSPIQDVILMPPMKRFETPEAYYSALYHEGAHATGHESRLNRSSLTATEGFGTETYSKEELVAEMTAAMLCGVAGIVNVTVENSAAYLRGWYSKLAEDKRILVTAAAQAQKAADFILQGYAVEEAPAEEEELAAAA
jgi:antirestriction protein ArdC